LLIIYYNNSEQAKACSKLYDSRDSFPNEERGRESRIMHRVPGMKTLSKQTASSDMHRQAEE